MADSQHYSTLAPTNVVLDEALLDRIDGIVRPGVNPQPGGPIECPNKRHRCNAAGEDRLGTDVVPAG